MVTIEQYRRENALPKESFQGFHSVGKLRELFPNLSHVPKRKQTKNEHKQSKYQRIK